MEKLAVIDLGSNSIRMSIYEISGGVYKEIKSFRNMIKLSEGMNNAMQLQPDAELRAVRAVMEYKTILIRENVEDVTAVATAAVRKAANGAEFLETLRKTTGISVEVIDGETEAYYDFMAVTQTLGCRSGIICDIGGGSTEIIGVADNAITEAVSIPFGSRSITEQFFETGETDESFLRAKDFIKTRINALLWLDTLKNFPIIGIGGCLRAVAKYDIKDSTNSKLKSHEIRSERLKEIFAEIMSASAEERKRMPGIGEERADIILGGIIPLMCIEEKIKPPHMTVADVGVRDGILFDFMNRQR